MHRKLLKNRNLLTVVLSCIVIGILVIFSPIFHILNKNIQNNYYSLKNSIFSKTANTNIVISIIDKKTLNALGRFPFSRKKYVNFIENIQNAGGATIGFDIIFADESKKEDDLIFKKTLEKSKIPIIFWSSITSKWEIELPLW